MSSCRLPIVGLLGQGAANCIDVNAGQSADLVLACDPGGKFLDGDGLLLADRLKSPFRVRLLYL